MTNPLLIPQPMTPEQVADLVERTRKADAESTERTEGVTRTDDGKFRPWGN